MGWWHKRWGERVQLVGALNVRGTCRDVSLAIRQPILVARARAHHGTGGRRGGVPYNKVVATVTRNGLLCLGLGSLH